LRCISNIFNKIGKNPVIAKSKKLTIEDINQKATPALEYLS